MLDDAAELAHQLHASADVGLAHGDFQLKNVLQGPRGLQVIDPLAGMGDRHLDAALFAVALEDDSSIDELLTQFAAAGWELDRLRAWASVLAACEYRPSRRPALSSRCAQFLTSGASPLRVPGL